MPTHRTTTSALLQARFPLDLVAQAEQLAARLGCSLSDLLREGLALRLASDNPPDSSPDTSPVELSDAVRRYLDQQIEAVVNAKLAAVGHPPPALDPPAVRRARHDVPPPDAPVSGASYDPTKFYLATLCKRGRQRLSRERDSLPLVGRASPDFNGDSVRVADS